MRSANIKWIAAAAFALALGPQTVAHAVGGVDPTELKDFAQPFDAPSTTDTGTLDPIALAEFAQGLDEVRADLNAIIEEAGFAPNENEPENDAKARALALKASGELASAAQKAHASSEHASNGLIQKAYDKFVDACIESSWAAADLASAAFAALEPPRGSWTPASPNIKTTMQRVQSLRASARCP